MKSKLMSFAARILTLVTGSNSAEPGTADYTSLDVIYDMRLSAPDALHRPIWAFLRYDDVVK